MDAAFTGIPNLTLRVAGAYNDASYGDTVLLPQAAENGNLATPYVDANGRSIQGVQKLSGNLSGIYEAVVRGERALHLNFNYHYGSSRNGDASQSRYAEVGSYGLLDLSVGYGRRDGAFDVSVIGKNILNKEFAETQTWTQFVPGVGRWVGIAVSGQL